MTTEEEFDPRTAKHKSLRDFFHFSEEEDVVGALEDTVTFNEEEYSPLESQTTGALNVKPVAQIIRPEVVSTENTEHDRFVKKSIEKATESVAAGGFPAGAVVVVKGKIVGEGISIGNTLNDPTSHGELTAIRDACNNLNTTELKGSTLYASMEPCSMCHSAAMWAGIKKIVYACSKEKVSSLYYGGTYKTSSLNDVFNKPITLIHIHNQEKESLMLVKQWEATFLK